MGVPPADQCQSESEGTVCTDSTAGSSFVIEEHPKTIYAPQLPYVCVHWAIPVNRDTPLLRNSINCVLRGLQDLMKYWVC